MLQNLHTRYSFIIILTVGNIFAIGSLVNVFNPMDSSKYEMFKPILEKHGIQREHIAGALRISKDGKYLALYHISKKVIFEFNTKQLKRIIHKPLPSYDTFQNYMNSCNNFRSGEHIVLSTYTPHIPYLTPEITYAIMRKTILENFAIMPANRETVINNALCQPVWSPDNKRLVSFFQKKRANLSARCSRSYKELHAHQLNLCPDTHVFFATFMPNNKNMLLGTSQGLYKGDLMSGTNTLYRHKPILYIHAVDNGRVAFLIDCKDFIVRDISSERQQIKAGSIKKMISSPYDKNQCILIPDENNHDDPRPFTHNFQVVTGRFDTQAALDGSLSSQGEVAFIEQQPQTGKKVINFWNAKTREKTESNIVNIANIHAVEWDPQGSQLAIAAKNRLYLYDKKTKHTKLITEHDVPIHSLSWSPDGRQIAVCGDTSKAEESIVKVIRLYDKELLLDYLFDELDPETQDNKKPPILEQWLLLYLLMAYKQSGKPLLINDIIKHVNSNSNVRLTLAGLTQVKDLFPEKVQYALGDLFDIHVRK